MWEQITRKKKVCWPAKVIARQSILGRSSFAKYLAESQESSLRWVLKESWLDDHYGDYHEDAWGHDYFFPPAELPNFEIPEKKEDIQLLFQPCGTIGEENLRVFKEKFRTYIINNGFRARLDAVDNLSLFGTKSSFNVKDLKSSSHYNTHIGKRFGWDSRKTLEFKYKWIQKNAAEGRAAVICSPDTLYKIKWLHKSWKSHVRVPGDEYNNPRILGQMQKILKNFGGSKGFVMSDIKKSGLTFSRELNDIIFNTLFEETGDERYLYFVGYGGAKVHGTSFGTKPIVNGYGLGMMDCVISAAQACIFQILLDTTLGDWNKSFDLKGHFWSDDSLGVLRPKGGFEVSHENLEGLLEGWNEGMIRYGIVVHSEKPFFSKVGVFLEEYSRDPRWCSRKVTQYVSCILDSLCATDIAAAKQITSAVATTATEDQDPWTGEAIQRVVDLWGYEFSPLETSLPYEIGGWTYNLKDGKNTLLQFMDHAPENEFMTRVSNLLNFSEKRRSLKAHKDHAGYISEVACMHGSEVTGAWSWYQISRSALLTDYKASRDTLSIRKKVLRQRQDLYKKPVDDRQNTALLNMRRFCERSCTFGWYIPLSYALESFPQVPSYPVDMMTISDPGSLRLALCAWNGYFKRNLDLNSIELDSIENHPETAFRILSAKYCEKGPIPAKDLEFIWSYGVSPWFWNETLRERIGRPVKLAIPINEWATKIIAHYMKENDPEGSVVWTPRGAFGSSLDAFSPLYNSFDGRYIWGIGLFHSNIGSLSSSMKMGEGDVRDIEREISRYALIGRKGDKPPSVLEDSEVLMDPEHLMDHDEYITDMIRGFTAQQALAESMHPPDDYSPGEVSYTHIPLEGSGYDSDISLNMGFMEDA